MALTLSAVVLFSLISLVLVRSRSVGIGAATMLFLFGFFVADTGASSAIHTTLQAIAGAVTNLTA
ncbi:hypothetical protein E0L36_25220 [Streptomyces sp. AJS327]|uniref:hypothetical protein n=1 Tax=Streptomyces sp. AJS327 TaxID=2545265 RepID=UPI0015E03B5D|nr:hypothetical protein [Streptomyces sp. AJS327]MBA0054031.1 hypothetical protein [Streptomyces sp. AJS327]